MSKVLLTDFSKRTGSPFQNKAKGPTQEENKAIKQEVILQKSNYDKQKEKQQELEGKVNKKTAEIQSNKLANSDGCFIEVVSHGAFQSKNNGMMKSSTDVKSVGKTGNVNGTNNSKSLLGFPSSANDLALEAKSDLESDKNISEEVKEKVIRKLFGLVSMVQHTYESKVRITAEYEKFKEKYLKDESRREKEHSEQLYKLNINFQTEVVQALQQLRSELDLTRTMGKSLDENSSISKEGSIVYASSEDENKVNFNSNDIVIVSSD